MTCGKSTLHNFITQSVVQFFFPFFPQLHTQCCILMMSHYKNDDFSERNFSELREDERWWKWLREESGKQLTKKKTLMGFLGFNHKTFSIQASSLCMHGIDGNKYQVHTMWLHFCYIRTTNSCFFHASRRRPTERPILIPSHLSAKISEGKKRKFPFVPRKKFNYFCNIEWHYKHLFHHQNDFQSHFDFAVHLLLFLQFVVCTLCCYIAFIEL